MPGQERQDAWYQTEAVLQHCTLHYVQSGQHKEQKNHYADRVQNFREQNLLKVKWFGEWRLVSYRWLAQIFVHQFGSFTIPAHLRNSL